MNKSSHIPLKWWTHVKLCCVALQNLDNDFQHFMIIGILDRNYRQFSLELLLCNWEIDAWCILSCDWMSPTWSRLSKRGNLTCRTVKNFHVELPCMEHLSLQARYKTAKNMEYSTEVLHKKFQWIHTNRPWKLLLIKVRWLGPYQDFVIVTTIALLANKSVPNSRKVHWIFTNRQF